MGQTIYRKIFKALNEDLNMILSDDDFEEPEIDLGVHISNIQKNILSDCILKKCKEQDEQGLKELINNSWDGEAATAAISKFNEIRSNYSEARYNVLDNYVNFLIQLVGDGYTQTEVVNTSLADQFK